MKIGHYDPKIKSLSKYESLCLLTMQKNDPGIITSKQNTSLFNKNEEPTLIISSTQLRGKQTATLTNSLLTKQARILYTNLANEIIFDMSTFCSKKQYEKHGSNIVRQKFINSFSTNKLIEKHHQLHKRFEQLRLMLKTESQFHKNILIVSHTFFIKLFIIYIDHPDLFTKPNITRQYINPQARIMQFYDKTLLDKTKLLR